MAYTRVNWQNSPSHATPLSAENLNVMDAGIAGLDAAVEGHTTSIGTLANLTTTEKSNLVGAINEVNEDVSDVKEDLGSITVDSSSPGYDENDNLLEGLTLQAGYYVSNNAYEANSNFSYLAVDISGQTKIKIGGTHHTYTTSQFNQLGVFVDDDNQLVEPIVTAYGSTPATVPYEVTIPDGATKIRLNTDYKASEYPSSLPDGLYIYPWVTNTVLKVKNSAMQNAVVEQAELSASGKRIKVIAGVIRNDGNGWAYINDSGHEPLNLSSVSVDSNGRIVIGYDFTASKVLSLVATPDETFASKYIVGGSVGLSSTVIEVATVPQSIGGRIVVTNGSVDLSNSSFTSYTLDSSTGELRLYHPTLFGISAKYVFNINAFCEQYGLHYGSQAFDYISLYIKDGNGGYIKSLTGLSFNMWVNRAVPSAHINANDVSDAGGNFWIFGVMEIE